MQLRQFLRVASIVGLMVFASSLAGVVLALPAAGGPTQGTSAVAPTVLAPVRTAPTTPSGSAAAAPTSPSGPIAPGPAAEAALMAKIHSSGADLQKVYPPNLLYAPQMHDGMVVHPSYPAAPEPVGVGDYGVMNTTGTPSSYVIDTTSYKATVGLNSVTPYYLANGVPEGFTSQLNVVLKNVTLFGQSNYNFWTQNVFFYDAYSQQLFIENNIWNFSAPAAGQAVNTFYYVHGVYTNGTDNPGVGYYADGTPTYNGITTPFTIVFYLNASTAVLSGTAYTEVDFAFDLLNGAGVQTMNWTYDRVLFNNTGGGATIPQAQFHVDGSNITPTGFIPYDAEVMLGGPGGGSTATFDAINGTMTLQHWNATAGAYVNELATWSSGSETGETAVGVDEYYDANGTVHLGGGPEFIQPFWNSSPSAFPGAAEIRGTITPSNSWAFVSPGSSYNTSTSAWAPIPPSGSYSWNLTSGLYNVKLMESDYTPVTAGPLNLTTGAPDNYNPILTANASAGVYTPLYAWSNAQLAAISSSGAGTLTDPYILVNNEVGALAPEFATANDYFFESYAGISLVGTTAYVEIANPAPFSVNYWGPYLNSANNFGVPSSNNLPIWLFQTSHVSIVGGTVQGWFTSNQDGFPYANILLWNTTSTLVAGVTFSVSTDAVFTYGGTNNTFAGNTFGNAALNAAVDTNLFNPSDYFWLGAPYNSSYSANLGPSAILENEGGDSIWNNYFATTDSAFESNMNVFDDLYLSFPANFTNDWNLSAPIPSSAVTTVNGIPLTGSVTGNATVCGNWWWNYLPNSALPYANPYPTEVPQYEGTGNIIIGGDYCPSGPGIFPVPVTTSGLATGVSWTVLVVPLTTLLPYGGPAAAVAPATVPFGLPAGQYAALFNPVVGYTQAQATYTFQVTSAGGITTGSGPVSEIIGVYTAIPTLNPNGTAIFAESGLPAGTQWTVTFNSTAYTSTTSAISVSAAAGSYSFSIGSVAGFTATPNSGTATVGTGTVTTTSITFAGTNGWVTGTVSPTSATVWVDGTQVTVTNGAFNVSEGSGVRSVEATASGHVAYFNNVTVAGDATTAVAIKLASTGSSPPPTQTNTTTSSSGLSSTDVGLIVGALIVFAIAIVVAALLLRGRGGSGKTSTGPSSPSTSTTPGSGTSGGPPPSH